MATTTYKGHCDCGQTEWEVKLTADQASHVLCHCDDCKRVSTGAYTLNQIIPKSALTFTKGGDALKVYTYKALSGNPTHCYYCPNCTTHPYHHQTVLGPDTIVLRTGLLDGAKDFPVAAEIFCKDMYKWESKVAPAGASFDITPPS
ncbi:hypothetical protein NA57DRAFT_44429 [Rhizodiscina lignyota]|uniref:CENP-V/GFA domain-containing protein n=1 Tax=Rhizodiscina lignyota TaxID=1504668 RepID=A0A9P4M381_9PEZI|nr:hypothetical protein NA57DRAFT_44429 [Rhizodiscina lignyota]